VFVLFGPALLALWLRRRDERRGTAGSAVVWLSWVLTGTLLYWVTALSLSDVFGLSFRLGLTNPLAVLALGVALFSLPLLLASAICTLILSPPSHAESPALRLRLAGTVVLQQAVYLVPLGLFVSGTSLMEYSQAIAIGSLPAAFVLYRILNFCALRYRVGGFQALTSGGLYERVSALAQSAGTRLNGVFILGNRRAAEANASANSKGFITLTRGLVDNLTRREVDAVVAHEVGHLRGKHPSLQMWLLVAYFVLRIPAGALLPRTGPAAVLLSLPIFPIVYVLVAARVSQRHEFNADMRAVALTGDPEGKIAALARLRRLGKSPVDWGGIQGSILSHPSMRQRVLALGNRFGVPPERALAILADPDVIAPTPDVPRHYDLPAEVRDTGLVFTSSAKATYTQLAFWAMQAVLVAIVAAMAYVSNRIVSLGFDVLLLLASIPAAAWLYLRIAHASDYLFLRWLERRIRRRIPCAKGAMFVGLVPGENLRPYEGGFYEWDLGLVSLESGCLTYSGERTRFSLPRAEIVGFAIRKGPLAWQRERAVLLRHTGGAFLLKLPRASWWRARRLEKKLTAWWRGGIASPEVPGAEPLPPPGLPALTFSSPSRWKVAWRFGKVAFFQFFGLSMALAALGHTAAGNPLYSLLILVVPLTYLLAAAPMLFRRRD
jgi:Zn-dependent protease with chaperone function